MAATPIRKVLVSAFGDTSNIAVVNTTIDAPASNEVQIQVVYSGFSGADVAMRIGRYPRVKAAPLTPGYSCVGRVVANGARCARFAPGSVVAAITVYDAQADLVNVPEKYVLPVPADLAGTDNGLQQVTALVLDWNTAYGMVMRAAEVKKGQRVFIHGLSGAVGYASMMLCKMQGADIYGTASERNHIALRELGVTPFVYTNKDWISAMNALGGAHAVFDPLGFESWGESYAILADAATSAGGGGILVGYGGNQATLNDEEPRSVYPQIAKLMGQNLKLWSNKRTNFYYIDRNAKVFFEDMDALMGLLSAGDIRVPIKRVWNLDTDAVREAHQSWGKLPGMGSLLVRVAEKA